MKFRRTLLINLFLLFYVTIIYAQTEVKIPLPKNLKQGYPRLYITQDEKSNLELTIQNEDKAWSFNKTWNMVIPLKTDF